MATAPVRLTKLLRQLHQQRSTDAYADDFPSQPSKPTQAPTTLPTLKRGSSQPITPLLAARFTFAGRWLHASLGMEWLAPTHLRKAYTDVQIRQQIAIRREHWDGCILAQLPPERITLFGIDRVEFAEVYLAWKRPGTEPAVHWYTGQHEYGFANLTKYVEFLLS
jgi:hypothetical protein